MGWVYEHGPKTSKETGKPIKGTGFWYVKVVLGRDVKPVETSTGLSANGNIRIAHKRRKELERDIEVGRLSAETSAWLSKTAANQIERYLACKRGHRAIDWSGAMSRYLAARTYKDIRPAPNGKINTSNVAAVRRAYLIGKFVTYMIRVHGDEVIRSVVDQAIIEYLSVELQRVKPITIWNGDLPFVLAFIDWMAASGHCDPPDRKAIKSSVPPAADITVKIHSVALDLAAHRKLQEQPVTPLAWAVWCLFVIVRGVGCRPNEAISLSWDTVDLTPGFERIKFLDTKEVRNTSVTYRTAPILHQWVLDAVHKMNKAHGGQGLPVCPKITGGPWFRQTYATSTVARAFDGIGLGGYTLKPAQKSFIMQLLWQGFPPHAVARWTGHTLSMQERHYMEEDAYLPGPERDYAEMAPLSDHGVAALEKLRVNSFSSHWNSHQTPETSGDI